MWSMSTSATRSAALLGKGQDHREPALAIDQVITALLPSLLTTSRVAGTRYCVPAPQNRASSYLPHTAQAKSQRLTGRQKY